MLLSKVVFSGLNGFANDVSIDLNSLSILIGPNGSGKTTILKALHFAMYLIENRKLIYFIEKLPNDFQNKWFLFDSISLVFTENNNGKITIPDIIFADKCVDKLYLTFAKVDNCYILSKICFDDISISTHPHGGIHNPSKLSVNEGKDISNNISNAMKLPSITTPSLDAFNELSKKTSKKYEYVLNSNPRTTVGINLLDQIFHYFSFPSVIYISSKDEPNNTIDGIINTASELRNGNNDARNSFNELIVNIKSFLESNVDIYNHQKNKSDVLHIDGKPNEYQSDGTQRCMLFFSLINNINSNCLIIWDEPENSLHATRRYKLVDLMLKDSRQYIYGTHAQEMAPISNEKCSIYRLNKNKNHPSHVLTIENLIGRRLQFQLLEDLGIIASRHLFNANVLLWVEGPTELLFWRAMLKSSKDAQELIEGFDYSIMLYGGSNIANIDIDADKPHEEKFDLLAINRYPLVLADHDKNLKSAENDPEVLKARVEEIKRKVEKRNLELSGSAKLIVTGGREVENYLPIRAIQYALMECNKKWKKEDKEKIADFSNFQFEQYASLADSIEKHLKNTGINFAENGFWRRDKVGFMRLALKCPEFKIEDLQNQGTEHIKEVIKWIRELGPESCTA